MTDVRTADTATKLRGYGVRNAQAFRTELARNVPFALAVLAYLILSVSILTGSAAKILTATVLGMATFAVVALVSILILQAGLCFFVTKPESPIRELFRLAKSALRGDTLGRWFAFLSLLAVLTAIFSVCKTSIPVEAGGFNWDLPLMEMNRILHFGYLPWEILQPIFGYAWITHILDLNYVLWFTVMWVFVLGVGGCCKDEIHRQQTLLAFVLIWSVGGSLIATVLSSAGPCFYSLVVPGADPYAGLMAYLHRTDEGMPLLALRAQSLLWADYASADPVLGISAMPSMHNGVAALMVLASWRFNIWLRSALVLHAVLIFLGSILLGWHYGIDAYAAWILTFAFWKISRPIAAWWVLRGQQLRVIGATEPRAVLANAAGR